MHMNKAEIGDVVRSYDFQPMPDRGDCYIEGIVMEKNDFMYKIVVQNRVWDGKKTAVELGEYIHTAFEVLFGEWENRIQKLGPAGTPEVQGC